MKIYMAFKSNGQRAQLRKEMRRGFLSIWILWTLKKKRDKMYGYEIMQSLQLRTKGMWAPKAGTIYPILRRLEKRGFVKSEWAATKTGGPSRRYYKMTPEGKKVAETLFSEWRNLMVGFREFLHELFGD
jgi:PadR family transcriptional regulator PadR